MKITSENLAQALVAVESLVAFAEACDDRLASMGKGLARQGEHGDVIGQAKAHARVIKCLMQQLALDELCADAQF
jgi:hypothetical protein